MSDPYAENAGLCVCGHAEDAHIGGTGLCAQPYEDGSGVGGCKCRRFTQAGREAIAAAIYRLNGQALYGRGLGEFDGDRMEAERWRWLEQADLVLAALSNHPAPVSSGEAETGERRITFDRHGDGFRCYGWTGSRWHNPSYWAPHIHCQEPDCKAECQPCSVGDGFHRSSPHKPAEHEACACPAPVVAPSAEEPAEDVP